MQASYITGRPSDRRRPNGSADENDRPWERFPDGSGTRGLSPNASAALRASGGRNPGWRRRARELPEIDPAA
jgi:hypothetical protein